MKIHFIEEIKEYFLNSEHLLTDSIFVGEKLRRCWMLNHETVIIRGKVYEVFFKDQGGGVWRAGVVPLHESRKHRVGF